MALNEIFEKQIDRDIDGVIKADDNDNLKQEDDVVVNGKKMGIVSEFDIAPIRETIGPRIFKSGFNTKEAGKAMLSGLIAAMVLGVTSAKIRIIKVKRRET